MLFPYRPRPDLDEFRTVVVLEAPSFSDPETALKRRAGDWFVDGLTAQEAARRAQLLSGLQLVGRELEDFAEYVEQVHEEFQDRPPSTLAYPEVYYE